MMYAQCSQGVRDKRKASKDWETVEQEQSLHDLISQVERICVGFDDHKQDVFNLVQALKTLFLYTQGNKESIQEYGHNFRSLWDTVEAFGRSPGYPQGADRRAPDAGDKHRGSPIGGRAKESKRGFFRGS